MNKTLEDFQHEVGEWGIETFPYSDIISITRHLQEEMTELSYEIEVGDWHGVEREIPDVALLMLHYCQRQHLNFFEMLKERFDEVKSRKWDDGSKRGYSKHIKE